MKEMFIRLGSTVKEAMKALDLSANKLLFVVNENEALIGTVSDGDIRRFLLSDGILSEDIEKCYNSNPLSVSIDELKDENKLKQMFIDDKMILLPVLDEKKRVIKFLDWECVFTDDEISKPAAQKIDVPVIIMAGGKGTRMAPFTDVLPKPLIPIGNKTMLEYIIDEYSKYQIKDYYITVNYKGNLIKAYFNGSERDYNIEYLTETSFLGTASSLQLLTDVPDTVIVSNCDIIVKADYNDVLKFHRESNSVLTILSSIQHHAIPYGVIEFENGGKVTDIKEKPEFSMPINTGVYILDKEAWNYIPKNEFFHMTHLIDVLMKENKNVMTYPVSESDYIDIGQWDEYKRAVNKFL